MAAMRREGGAGGKKGEDKQGSKMDRGCPLRWEMQMRSSRRSAKYIADEETKAQRSSQEVGSKGPDSRTEESSFYP